MLNFINILFYDRNKELLGSKCTKDASLEFARGYAHCMAYNDYHLDEGSEDVSFIEYTTAAHILIHSEEIKDYTILLH